MMDTAEQSPEETDTSAVSSECQGSGGALLAMGKGEAVDIWGASRCGEDCDWGADDTGEWGESSAASLRSDRVETGTGDCGALRVGNGWHWSTGAAGGRVGLTTGPGKTTVAFAHVRRATCTSSCIASAAKTLPVSNTAADRETTTYVPVLEMVDDLGPELHPRLLPRSPG